VDEQSAEDMRANRGDFGKPGVDSPFRTRTVEQNLTRFREMREGQLADGARGHRAAGAPRVAGAGAGAERQLRRAAAAAGARA
jgi:hypothetical protein